jgi:hypothetical protein
MGYALYSAMTEDFEEITIRGKPAILTSECIDALTVPDGYFKYELSNSKVFRDDQIEIAKKVQFGHWATIIMRDEIDLPSDGVIYAPQDSLVLNTGDCQSMEEYMRKYPPRDDGYIDTTYKLVAANDKRSLFSKMDGESAERHGAIGYLRADFGNDGNSFWTTWFDIQKHLRTPGFRDEFDEVIQHLRDGGQEPPFANRRNLDAFVCARPGMGLTPNGSGYLVRTDDHTYYFRCYPCPGEYEIYGYAYDNRYLLPELAGQHELPDVCYSTNLSSEAIILIKNKERGYYPCEYTTGNREYNRALATDLNIKMGVTRAQEEAMVAGSMFGWGVPGAKPWKYDMDGRQRHIPKKSEPVR